MTSLTDQITRSEPAKNDLVSTASRGTATMHEPVINHCVYCEWPIPDGCSVVTAGANAQEKLETIYCPECERGVRLHWRHHDAGEDLAGKDLIAAHSLIGDELTALQQHHRPAAAIFASPNVSPAPARVLRFSRSRNPRAVAAALRQEAEELNDGIPDSGGAVDEGAIERVGQGGIDSAADLSNAGGPRSNDAKPAAAF